MPNRASYTVDNLVVGDSYAFRIRVDNSDGSVSNWSTASAYMLPTITAPIATLKGYPNSGGGNHLLLGWHGVPSDGTVRKRKRGHH